MPHRNGRQVVLQLIRAYEEEAKLYAGLAEAATEQHDLMKNGADRERLATLVERQRQLSEDIGKIEEGIAPLRRHWERIRWHLVGHDLRTLAAQLDHLLEELAERIHTIVAIEKANSRALLEAT